METMRERYLKQRIGHFLISFLRDERVNPERRWFVASLVNRAKIAMSALRKYEQTPQDFPVAFREVLLENFAVQVLGEISEEAVEALETRDPTAEAILSQIRQCDYCERWIFASRRDQRYCPFPSHCRQLWAAAGGKTKEGPEIPKAQET